MQMSELTYQMKPAFHPENCRQPKDEQADFSQTELKDQVATAVLLMLSSPTDGIHLWLGLQSPSPSLLHVVELLGSC